MKFELHPLCLLWPPMPERELAELAADINANGLRQPIVLHEGKILDGRNRALACERAGVAPAAEAYEGRDPVGFVISMNLHRRHLDLGQRAMMAARLANMAVGGDRKSKQYQSRNFGNDIPVSQAKVAKMLNMSSDSVGFAKTVLASGDAALIAAVDKGEIAVSAAAVKARADNKCKRAVTEEVRLHVRPYIEKGKPPPRAKLREQLGVSDQPVIMAVAMERGRAEGLKEAANRKTISVEELIEELHPLFLRVLAQAKGHAVAVSQVELGAIASAGQRLLERWASDDPTVRRMHGSVVSFKRPAIKERSL